MRIKILVNGGFGRMGLLTVQTITEHPEFELAGQTSREYDLKKSIKDSGADVVIDFTLPESVYQNALTIIEAGARPVIGTSGLTIQQVHKLQDKCAQLKRGGIIAPNFALGAVLMMKCAKEIVKYMPHVEILEMHHETKVDSPSGTALRTAELLANANKSVNDKTIQMHETVPGARGADYRGIPIHAIRVPGLLANQQIIFGGTGETLTLSHNSIDRKAFMPGVCLACEKVMELDRLVYGLEEVV